MSQPTIDPAEVRKVVEEWRGERGGWQGRGFDVVFEAAEAWLELVTSSSDTEIEQLRQSLQRMEETAQSFSVVERFHLGTIRRLEEELKRTRAALDHARRTGA